MNRTVDERLEELLAKVPGKYTLVSLFQKRFRELQRGLPPLVEIRERNNWQLVTEEILAGKVELLVGEEAAKLRKEAAAREARETEEDERPERLPQPSGNKE